MSFGVTVAVLNVAVLNVAVLNVAVTVDFPDNETEADSLNSRHRLYSRL